MEYNFTEIEQKWQSYWSSGKTFRVRIDPSRPKYYVLDMFPYPSGAGLHVGHPLGYIASDIYARYKKLKGYNVLHPMGYDAFGLPAEQYAIQTGQPPQKTTEQNIRRYREQMDKLGFSYDWDREIQTCDPSYYKWTQWAFLKMFHHWYNKDSSKAEPIDRLIDAFNVQGNGQVQAAHHCQKIFSAREWHAFSEKEKEDILMCYRIAYLGETTVNWCAALGTVLANDEVKEGLSLRGGYPVEQKKMKQWQLRVSAYAERLLEGLDRLDWSDSLKEMQRNWIGKSDGTEMEFRVSNGSETFSMTVFTTRADTIFGVTFMVLAPESEWVEKLTVPGKRKEVEKYLAYVKTKTERERMTQTHRVTGVFTGSYATHPFTGKEIPVWVSEYVMAGYGTGAIMAVPAHDRRDYIFAKHFDLPVIPLIEGCDISSESFDAKEGVMCNSDFLNGMTVQEAIPAAIREVEKRKLGKRKTNYRLRDAIFSRQRYWGEPFPIYYQDGIARTLPESSLPLELPAIDSFHPSESGEPPLARTKNWTYQGYPLETSTMPGFAGSSAYYLRYMDPHNPHALVSAQANKYWQDVDLYIGGTEHATGHLIYSRFWNKFLYDLRYVCKDEPFRKLVNQGMIQGRSSFVYRIKNTNTFVSCNLKDSYETTEIHVDVNLVTGDRLDLDAFRAWNPEYKDAEFILENGEYICGWAIEKMSKSMFNVVNPDTICARYGADTLRMYEMFLGPLEQSKPWDTNGIDGVHRFLRKFWRLFFDKDGNLYVNNHVPDGKELKILHNLIHKVEEDIENFSFNTTISAFMISVNELADLDCHKREILEPLVILISPYAPHIAEELWTLLGNSPSVANASFPVFNPEHTKEQTFEYPVSFNGKLRFKKQLGLNLESEEIIRLVVEDVRTEKYSGGEKIKKVIVIPGKIINIVI
ncbi:MAG: leucine--tRNA ligase [Bacteroidales bacterium]|jgi:leucyl-tRNA synthetase|nr:leucine--tRNA ligase [Bacteroidales bacterium]MDD2264408.1 leucine--tRNA ligase [Bacteroidales bacterium]MDD2831642.1 leucine--tRNA ligase [Bacteroidales bacterium]MDD3209207.1 leucine--tRNA ligase [Bacteroidales bacterium]MDD3697508.1 leucine--tRNA ligase [Bacteroidales bacterium]